VGSQVTLLEALPNILPGVDQQVAQVVARAFTKRGVTIETGVKVGGAERNDGAFALHYEAKDGAAKTVTVDKIVVSVGRRPRSEGIGLDEASVKVDERGFVVVDGSMRTNVDGVYAV